MGHRVETDHRFEYGELIFEFSCPDCGEEIQLTNPWVTKKCRCGRTWRLDARAVSGEAPGDDEGDDG